MNQKKILLFCILAMLSFPKILAQQKPQFTQYMFNGLIINPAFAGYDEALNITLLNRSQWGSIEGAPVTQTLSAHSPFGSSRLGGGITIVNDKIGVHKNQVIQGSLSYRLTLAPQTFLFMGLQSGVSIHKSAYSSISNGGGVDPRAQDVANTSITMGAGFYLKSKRFDLGISAPEILPEKFTANDSVTITWQKAQYFIFSKYRFTLQNNLELEPSLLVKYMADLPLSLDLNVCLIIKKVLTTGLSYRNNESVGFIVKAKLSPQLQFGYAYDYGIGEVSRHSNGSHELMASYLFKYSRSNLVQPR